MIRNRSFKFLLLAAILTLASSGYIQTASAVEMPKRESPIKIKGDSVEYFFEKETAEGRGNVRIDHGTSTLTADEIDVNLKTKEATARGNVVLTQPGAKYEGSKVFINFETGDAVVDDMKVQVEPFYRGYSKSMKRINGTEETQEYFVFENAYFTTCEEATDCQDGTPQYRLEAQQVQYYPEDKLVMHHVVMRLRNLPIFYFPMLVLPIKDIREFPVQLELGQNDEWGFFGLSKYRYYINDDHDGNLLFDVREKQKFAWGVEHFYRNEQWGNGALRTYFANDRCGDDDTDCSKSGEIASGETHRYRLQMRHSGQIEENTGLNFEFNKLSDEYMIQDFFYREEFERVQKPENYLSVIHAKDEYTLSGLVRYRLDDFIGEVERLPEFRLDTHTDSLGDTPFYFRSETAVSMLNKTFKDYDEDELSQSAARIDQRHRLSYVWRIGEWTATPFVGSRHTFYNRDAAGDDRNFVRNFMEAGVDVSTKYFKIYDYSFDAFGIKFDQLRHVFTPNISYLYRSKPTHTKESLVEFDSVDTFDHDSRITLDFENKLQIKYMEKNKTDSQLYQAKRTLVRSIVSADLKIPRGNETRLDAIESELQLFPYSWLGISTETRYSFETDEFEYMNLDASISKGDWKIGFGQRYVNGSSNQSTIHAEWQMNDDWKFEVYERFDFQRNSLSTGGENNEFEAVVEKKNIFCWTVRFIYNHSNGGDGFFVTLSPSAFSEGAYRRSQSYRELYDLTHQRTTVE